MRFITRARKTERAKRVTDSLYRSYFRTLYFSRLAWVAFWACFVYFLLWSIPVFGIGLSAKDYTPQFTITLVFAVTCILLGTLSGALRKIARRKRETLAAWSSLHDETTGTHTRSHLYDRLSLECERSERHGGSFALLLLKLRAMREGRLPGRGNNELLRIIAERVQGVIRTSDLVALISNDEFGVLLCGVSAGTASVLAERLRDSLEWDPRQEKPPIDFKVDVGTATYSEDVRTPEALVEAARASIADQKASGRPLKTEVA